MDTKKQSEIRLNEDGKRIPTRADGPTAILRYLMTYCVCPSDEDYNRRAVDYLLRKLQDNKKAIRALIETITWRGTRPSKCFTVPRTLDGRFQVATRKGFPHVVYARIWRWGDLEKCQIMHIPTCKYGYDLNRDHICVNPYHYKKITTVEEFYSKLKSATNTDSNKNKNKSKSRKKNQEAACSQNIAVNDGGKKQDMPQQQQSQEIYQLNGENLIPIVVEHQSNATEYIEPQQSHLICNYIEETKVQPQIPETYPTCDTLYANNNSESTVPPGSINDQCDYSNNMYNLHQPAIESNLHEHNNVKLLQGHGHNQNHTPLQLHSGIQENENNFIQDNRNVETPVLSLSICEQVLLNQSDFQNLSLSNNQRQDKFEKIINLPAPSNTLLVNNPPLVSNCNQPSQDLVRGDVGSVPMNAMPPPLPMNQMPPSVPTNEIPPSVLMNEMPPPRKISLSSNSIFVNSNQQINLPPPSSTPLPNNPPTFSYSLFEDEDFQSTERQKNELPTNYRSKLENKNMLLNCTLERILAEDDSQQTASNNPLENTLNETLDQILSQVQNNDQKLSSTDQKMENTVLSNNTEPITTQSNIEVLNSNEDLADNNVPMEVSNYEEMIEQNNNQQLQPISNASQLTQNIKAVSPTSVISPLSPTSSSTPLSSISSITPLSPISTVRSQSPISTDRSQSLISNTESLSSGQFQCDSNLLLLDSDDKKNTGKSSKDSIKQKQPQSDKTVFLDEDHQEPMAQKSNAQKNTSLHFGDTMISFINNNIMEQTQMSPVSKCEQYLRNQSGETNSLAYIQPPTNNNNNPHTHKEATILQTFQNSCMQNKAQQVHNPVQPQDTELQQSNFNEFFNMPNTINRKTKNLIPIDDPPLEHWCSIDYFELDTQVGETFKVKNEHTTVIVDGYLDPDGGNRFCLGRLTNTRRTEQSERTRMHIAQGIALELRNDGDIWLQCRSKNSVFIRAHFLDMQSDPSSRNSIHKIFSGECKKVFDLQRCYKHIKAQIATAQAALKVQQMTIGPPGRPINDLSGSKGLEAIGMNIDDLRRLCILQISFVKGWGSDYPRQTIKETPCWIEVHVHRALEILDNFLLLDKPIVRGMD